MIPSRPLRPWQLSALARGSSLLWVRGQPAVAPPPPPFSPHPPPTKQMWSDHHGESLTTSGSDYSQTIQLYQPHAPRWALPGSRSQRWCVTHSPLTGTAFYRLIYLILSSPNVGKLLSEVYWIYTERQKKQIYVYMKTEILHCGIFSDNYLSPQWA